MRVGFLILPLCLIACSDGRVANKPSDQGDALNSMSPANTPDNEAAAAGTVDDGLTNDAGSTPEPNSNQYDRK